MEAIRLERRYASELDLSKIDPELTEWDQEAYRAIVSTNLSDEQIDRIVNPPNRYPRQDAVLAVHWHPEFVPMDLIRRRVDELFPNRKSELIIPTQHNVLLEWGGFAGVEIDCYSEGFNTKVQLLAHFSARRVRSATVLKAMLAHTFRYRTSQLNEFLETLTNPAFDARIHRAAAKTGAPGDLVRFVQIHAAKLKKLLDEHEATTPADMIKNKLLRHYFDALREHHSDPLISHAQTFLNAVKKIVKANFALSYFYRTEEVIEEIRGLGGGIVIPHPEQFWPILLAEYDVDGIEVWNPQSQQYTEFLITHVHSRNKAGRARPLLIFMGDDTHFGEKVLDPRNQDVEKASRELGVQPGWEDLMIRKNLIVANMDRPSVIREYVQRLS